MSNEQNFDWEQPEEFGGGNFLKIGGTYHFAVLGEVMTEDADGKLIDGFRVQCEVLDGTVRDKKVCTEVRKTCNLTFFNGKMSHKDGGRFKRQQQAAFFVAANIITPADIPALLAKKFRPDLSRATAQQFIATVELTDDGKYIQLAGSDVYHIDDPNARAFPKDADSLTLIPTDCRRTPEQLQAIKDAFAGKSAASGNGAANGATNGNGGHAKRETVPAVNLDEI